MKKIIMIAFLGLALLGGNKVFAQGKSDDVAKAAWCDCIQKYSYLEHYDDYLASDYKCYRAWKKEMKRKKKECQAKALETNRPMAAERKKKRAEIKAYKRDLLEARHKDAGEAHDYWY